MTLSEDTPLLQKEEDARRSNTLRWRVIGGGAAICALALLGVCAFAYGPSGALVRAALGNEHPDPECQKSLESNLRHFEDVSRERLKKQSQHDGCVAPTVKHPDLIRDELIAELVKGSCDPVDLKKALLVAWEDVYKELCEHWRDDLHVHLQWPQPCSHCDVIVEGNGKYSDAGEPPHIGYNFIPGVTDMHEFCSFDPKRETECMKNGKRCMHQDPETKEVSSCKEPHWPHGNVHYTNHGEMDHEYVEPTHVVD